MDIFRLHQGSTPLIISIPHCGAYVPEEIEARFTPPALALPDTDWHVDTLYAFAKEMGATVLSAVHHRYVVDLNRPPGGESLYPGKFTTGTCPTQLFDETPLYKTGRGPTDDEIKQRITDYWQPYHDTLRKLITNVHKKYGRVILFDAHSIRTRVPSLFPGDLADLNLGTDGGRTCDKTLEEKLFALCKESPYSATLNGRFKGGYITRHYAAPEHGIHTVQMELTQRHYMEEKAPYTYVSDKAAQLQKTLKTLVKEMVEWNAATTPA